MALSFSQLRGLIKAWRLWNNRQARLACSTILIDRLENLFSYPAERQFILTVGFSRSGKSTLVNAHPDLHRYFQIDTDSIHRDLNERIPALQDNHTVRGSAYWARQFLTQWIREALLIRVCHEGINVVNQSCNLVRRERQQRLRIGRRHDYRTTLVHVICEHQTLCQRLMAADDLRKAAGQERVWLDLYLNVQRDRYQPPEPSEADQFRIHHSGQDSPADLRL